VFEALEQRMVRDDQWAAERDRRMAELRQQQERRAEIARLDRIEDLRRRRAVDEMRAWRAAQGLIEYAAALRASLADLDPAEHERVVRWCDLIDDHARRSDPTRSTSLVLGLDDDHSQGS
jgi:hypothetical protein